ncbi:uncharacterized protein LOC141903551 [Tubulanus polymorphus]|uniref:uncharacterized protein LOC141903551 n=1 Tax=Tubulanus polymorphus TaxID=672921 RepID=UPI003DA3711E
MSNDFQHGLCGCFDNFGLCVISFFVPCYTFGKNAEAVGDSCILCGLASLVPILNCIFGAKIREKVRERQNIEGTFVKDLLLFWCCAWCATVQVGQEVNHMQGTQSIARE